jgi:hypothetical protein
MVRKGSVVLLNGELRKVLWVKKGKCELSDVGIFDVADIKVATEANLMREIERLNGEIAARVAHATEIGLLIKCPEWWGKEEREKVGRKVEAVRIAVREADLASAERSLVETQGKLKSIKAELKKML